MRAVRSSSVSSPLSMTQALKGLMTGPVVRMKGTRSLAKKSSSPRMAATQGAALAVDVFGRRIDDDVGAEGERALHHGHAEHVVDDDAGADAMRQRRKPRPDVHDRHGRVTGALEKDAAGLRPQRTLPRVEVRAVLRDRFSIP